MHRFHIDLPPNWQTDEIPQALLDVLSAKAREAGAEIEAGAKAGSGSVNTPLGAVELAYELESPRLWLTVRHKPMLVSNGMVESGIRHGAEKYFNEFPDGLSHFSGQA